MQDTSIAEIDSNGQITGISVGQTKLKIFDTKNEIETYVYINVINGIKPMLVTGSNFTVSLKTNGTVWSYGRGNTGQLGNRRKCR